MSSEKDDTSSGHVAASSGIDTVMDSSAELCSDVRNAAWPFSFACDSSVKENEDQGTEVGGVHGYDTLQNIEMTFCPTLFNCAFGQSTLGCGYT